MSRPDPSRGRPRVEPVPVFLSFSTVRVVKGVDLRHVVLPRGCHHRDVGSSEVAARKLRRPLAVLPTRGVGALRVAWPRTLVDAPIVPSVAMLLGRCGFLPVVARATRVTRLWRVTTWVGCGGGCRWCLHVWWVVVVAFRCSLSWLCGCHLTRGLLLAVRGFVVVSDGGLSVMGFTSGFR